MLCHDDGRLRIKDFILETVEADYLATAHLMYSAIGNSLGAVAGNALCGAVAQAIGVQPMMILISAGGFIGCALILYAMHQKRRAI